MKKNTKEASVAQRDTSSPLSLRQFISRAGGCGRRAQLLLTGHGPMRRLERRWGLRERCDGSGGSMSLNPLHTADCESSHALRLARTAIPDGLSRAAVRPVSVRNDGCRRGLAAPLIGHCAACSLSHSVWRPDALLGGKVRTVHHHLNPARARLQQICIAACSGTVLQHTAHRCSVSFALVLQRARAMSSGNLRDVLNHCFSSSKIHQPNNHNSGP